VRPAWLFFRLGCSLLLILQLRGPAFSNFLALTSELAGSGLTQPMVVRTFLECVCAFRFSENPLTEPAHPRGELLSLGFLPCSVRSSATPRADLGTLSPPLRRGHFCPMPRRMNLVPPPRHTSMGPPPMSDLYPLPLPFRLGVLVPAFVRAYLGSSSPRPLLL